MRYCSAGEYICPNEVRNGPGAFVGWSARSWQNDG